MEDGVLRKNVGEMTGSRRGPNWPRVMTGVLPVAARKSKNFGVLSKNVGELTSSRAEPAGPRGSPACSNECRAETREFWAS